MATRDDVGFLTDHYNQSFVATRGLAEQRNRIFTYLILSIAVSIALTEPSFLQGFLRVLVYQAAGDNSSTIDLLPITYQVIHSLILVLVLYYMIGLYHRSASVGRGFAYVGALEREIRERLGLGDTDIAFTREGAYYWNNRPWFFGAIKYLYILLVGGLLMAQHANRLLFDARLAENLDVAPGSAAARQIIELGGRPAVLWGDVALATLTALAFLAYAINSIGLDRPSRRVGG